MNELNFSKNVAIKKFTTLFRKSRIKLSISKAHSNMEHSLILSKDTTFFSCPFMLRRCCEEHFMLWFFVTEYNIDNTVSPFHQETRSTAGKRKKSCLILTCCAFISK